MSDLVDLFDNLVINYAKPSLYLSKHALIKQIVDTYSLIPTCQIIRGVAPKSNSFNCATQ